MIAIIGLLLYGNDKFDDTKKLSNLLKIHRGLIRNFFDNLPACYPNTTIFICRFAEGFVFCFVLIFFCVCVCVNILFRKKRFLLRGRGGREGVE